jgi:response regulator of citrate/malate metabolism
VYALVSAALTTVDILLWYLNRPELLYDLQQTVHQLHQALTVDIQRRSVTTIIRNRGGRRKLSNRLTDDQVRELVAAFEAGTTRMALAERYGISRTSVARLLRIAREQNSRRCSVISAYKACCYRLSKA